MKSDFTSETDSSYAALLFRNWVQSHFLLSSPL